MAYSKSNWRNSCAPIIARVLAETAGKSEKDIRVALRAAYPYGQRRYHPYRIWLSEIAIQRKKKPPLGTFGPRKKKQREAVVIAGQMELGT